jgi:hypothetical protein
LALATSILLSRHLANLICCVSDFSLRATFFRLLLFSSPLPETLSFPDDGYHFRDRTARTATIKIISPKSKNQEWKDGWAWELKVGEGGGDEI